MVQVALNPNQSLLLLSSDSVQCAGPLVSLPSVVHRKRSSVLWVASAPGVVEDERSGHQEHIALASLRLNLVKHYRGEKQVPQADKTKRSRVRIITTLDEHLKNGGESIP